MTFETRDIPQDAGAITYPSSWFTYGAQLEPGYYPSSLLPPSGTRDPDVLSGSATMLCPGGFFDWQLQIAPNFASGEQSVDAELLWLDDNDHIYLSQSKGAIVMVLGGSPVVTSPSITFDREQVLTVTLSSSLQGTKIDVQGAKTGNGTTTGPSTAMSSPPATVYVLGNNAGARECFDLQKVAVSPP